MGRWVALLAACLCGSACTILESGQERIAIVAIELPEFCSRVVETRSDSVSIRPDVQTVVSQGCNRQDGIWDAPVVWLTLDRPYSTADVARQVDERAVQTFSKSRSTLDKPSARMIDFAEAAKKRPDVEIRIVAHADENTLASRRDKLSAARAQTVVAWLEKQGISPDRIRVIKEGGEAGAVTASMTLIVFGR